MNADHQKQFQEWVSQFPPLSNKADQRAWEQAALSGWAAAAKSSDAATIRELLFTRGELDLMRQWFNAVQDVMPMFADKPDRALKEKIDGLLSRSAGSGEGKNG
jgi:hypothetical protein